MNLFTRLYKLYTRYRTTAGSVTMCISGGKATQPGAVPKQAGGLPSGSASAAGAEYWSNMVSAPDGARYRSDVTASGTWPRQLCATPGVAAPVRGQYTTG